MSLSHLNPQKSQQLPYIASIKQFPPGTAQSDTSFSTTDGTKRFRRSPEEVMTQISRILHKRFSTLDAAFRLMPEYNSMIMTKETVYQLLKKYALKIFKSANYNL